MSVALFVALYGGWDHINNGSQPLPFYCCSTARVLGAQPPVVMTLP